jgi:acyl-CoA dehydrogenase
MHVMGYDDAPHGHDEVIFDNVKVPVDSLVLGEGRGFEVLQGRLGGGRIHHCMRTLGVANRALELMLLECTNPKKRPFGKLKGEQGKIQWDIAQSRIDLEMARRLVYHAANAMDAKGFKNARSEIAMAKIAVPNLALAIIDRAMQVYGGLGLSQSTSLASMWAHVRTLRLADGPDEAHAAQLARSELSKADAIRRKFDGYAKRASELQAKL